MTQDQFSTILARLDGMEEQNNRDHAAMGERIGDLEKKIDSYHANIHDDVAEVLAILKSDV